MTAKAGKPIVYGPPQPQTWEVRILLADGTWLTVPEVRHFYIALNHPTLNIERTNGEYMGLAPGRWQNYSATPMSASRAEGPA